MRKSASQKWPIGESTGDFPEGRSQLGVPLLVPELLAIEERCGAKPEERDRGSDVEESEGIVVGVDDRGERDLCLI